MDLYGQNATEIVKATENAPSKARIEQDSRVASILTFPSQLQPSNCSSHLLQDHTYSTRRGRILAAASGETTATTDPPIEARFSLLR